MQTQACTWSRVQGRGSSRDSLQGSEAQDTAFTVFLQVPTPVIQENVKDPRVGDWHVWIEDEEQLSLPDTVTFEESTAEDAQSAGSSLPKSCIQLTISALQVHRDIVLQSLWGQGCPGS